MTDIIVDGGVYDNLFQLVVHGPRESGEIPSKDTIGTLLEHKWITYNSKVDKCYAVTDLGIQTFFKCYNNIKAPYHRIFGAIRIDYVDVGRLLDGDNSKKPIVIFGGSEHWAKEHILGKYLNYAKSFREYDYTTFDFEHPITNEVIHLGPGDWIILNEDHDHVVHNFK